MLIYEPLELSIHPTNMVFNIGDPTHFSVQHYVYNLVYDVCVEMWTPATSVITSPLTW